MKAKEMFEKLDGVHSVDIKKTHVTGYGTYDDYTIILKFSDSKWLIYFNGFNERYTSEKSIDMDLHKAITQQLIELGWLDA